MSADKTYPVAKEASQHAHLREEHYLAMYDASINRPEEFWAQKADEFLSWFSPWSKVTEADFRKGEARVVHWRQVERLLQLR